MRLSLLFDWSSSTEMTEPLGIRMIHTKRNIIMTSLCPLSRGGRWQELRRGEIEKVH